MIIELCSPDGELVAQARTRDIYAFLGRALAAVPAGAKPSGWTSAARRPATTADRAGPTAGPDDDRAPPCSRLIRRDLPHATGHPHLDPSMCTCRQDLDATAADTAPGLGSLCTTRPLTLPPNQAVRDADQGLGAAVGSPTRDG